jgi:hypothetical protein
MSRRRRSTANRVAGVIAIVGLILAFTTGPGSVNVPIFFVALAFASLIGSLGTPNRASVFGGLHAFVWLLVVAIFISTGSGHIFFLGIVASLLLWLFDRAMFAQNRPRHPAMRNRPPTPYYQPSHRAPEEPPQRSYEQGYRPSATSQPAELLPPSDQYEQPSVLA